MMTTPDRRRSSVIVRPVAAGRVLIDFLADRFTYHDRDIWRQLIETAKVTINEAPVSPGFVLSAGDRISYHAPDREEPPVDDAYHILFEDEALLVVNKPGNLPCHPGGRYFHHTLWSLLRTERGPEDLSFVHRLDRETSGVVLIAKTAEDVRRCQTQFASGEVEKRYLVLAEGNFPDETVDAAGYIGRDPASPVRQKQRFVPGEGETGDGKPCRTRLRGIAWRDGISLVEAEPLTGRRHQIRATLHGLGFPVVGDKLYGPDDTLFLRFIADRLSPEDRQRLRLSRQALHAVEFCICHPRSGKMICFTAPMPQEMANCLTLPRPRYGVLYPESAFR